jgi:hypothetical protein
VTVPLIDEVLQQACQSIGLPADDAKPLRQHATNVYLLPAEQVVVRVAHSGSSAVTAERAVQVTSWLCAQGFPATEPINVPQPINTGEHTVTFWRYYPQGDRPTPEPWRLGALLRDLHQFPAPQITLPPYEPLARFASIVEHSTGLPPDDRIWLLDERQRLLDAYQRLDFPLGYGLIHGDAYPGNLLWRGSTAILGDWDELANGPRELDLANTHQGVRFGRSAEQLKQFSQAYGYNLTSWDGSPILFGLRDLHTLVSYVRLAERGDLAATAELRWRIDTLRAGQKTARWNAH